MISGRPERMLNTGVDQREHMFYNTRYRPLEIYVHIPFCVRKCRYCDFLSFPAGREVQRNYLQALLTEAERFAADQADGYKVRSVFLGGGTPSILPAEWIEELMEKLRFCFHLQEDAFRDGAVEATVEANPGTVTGEDLRRYRRAGINRLSIGCQSAVDAELAVLGRIHTAEQFREGFRQAREAGFSNISVDLMSGLPGQTEESWEYSLRETAQLCPEHISAYSLIIEEGTPFHEVYGDNGASPEQKRASRDFPPLPDEETERRMYAMTESILAGYGYHRYEISNYAMPGRESVHNTGYWTGVEYAGLGLGASSLLGNRRMKNTADLQAYLADPAGSRYTEEILQPDDQMAEFMILGLRMTRGVSEEEFRLRFGQEMNAVYGEKIRSQVRNGLLKRQDGRVWLTEVGVSLSNVVMREFLE